MTMKAEEESQFCGSPATHGGKKMPRKDYSTHSIGRYSLPASASVPTPSRRSTLSATPPGRASRPETALRDPPMRFAPGPGGESPALESPASSNLRRLGTSGALSLKAPSKDRTLKTDVLASSSVCFKDEDKEKANVSNQRNAKTGMKSASTGSLLSKGYGTRLGDANSCRDVEPLDLKGTRDGDSLAVGLSDRKSGRPQSLRSTSTGPAGWLVTMTRLPPAPQPLLAPEKLPKFSGRRLRVAVFNACSPPAVPHPAAVSCLATLLQTPWFHSHAVERLLGAACGAGGCNTVWTPVVTAEMMCSEDIKAGRLMSGPPPRDEVGGVTEEEGRETGDGFDVLLVPGGSTSADSKALGTLGLEEIRRFVLRGGAYCGICAGAFLALRYEGHDRDSLDLVDATAKMRNGKERDKVHEEEEEVTSPGTSPGGQDNETREEDMNVRFTADGYRWLRLEGTDRGGGCGENPVAMRFSNGPLMIPSPGSSVKVLATALPPDRRWQEGKVPVFLMQEVGEGRAVLISPHPESTPQATQSRAATGVRRAEPGGARNRRVLQRAILLAAAGCRNRSWIEELCHTPVWQSLPPEALAAAAAAKEASGTKTKSSKARQDSI